MSNLIFEGEAAEIYLPKGRLKAELVVPKNARGSVVMPQFGNHVDVTGRSAFLASRLHARGFATLIVDLAIDGEEESEEYVVKQELAERLAAAIDWLRCDPQMGRLPIGLSACGPSACDSACLTVAADRPNEILGITLCGGRPDLAGRALSHPLPPTLLIVGADDVGLIRPNKDAFRRIQAVKQLEFIEGASRGFQEAGKLQEAAIIAADWFPKHLPGVIWSVA